MAITDDSFFELDNENFTLELKFNPLEITASNVVLNPNASVFTILDDDGNIFYDQNYVKIINIIIIVVVIGFLNTLYTVDGSDEVANIQIAVIQGSLQRSVMVNLTIAADSKSIWKY